MAAQDPIRITKYTNRRLYDATNSRHLTLDQLVELIKEVRMWKSLIPKVRKT